MKNMNNKKLLTRIFSFTLLLCSFTSTTFASPSIAAPRPNIGKAENLQIIREIMPNFDKNTLVVFDVDLTLIKGKQGFPSISNGADLIDKATPKLIRDLQKKGIKVIALTHSSSEKETMKWLDSTQGELMPFSNIRFQQLQHFGINFSSAFPKIDHTYLSISTNSPPYFLESGHPCFYKGIIFTNTISDKGIVLSAFLDQFELSPNFIIFIDDNLQQNIVVAKSLEKLKADKENPLRNYICLHYTAASTGK